MLHTNRGELALLFDTFCRVWGAGGQATLTTTTKDGQVQANLELQLGHPAEARPGAPSKVQQRLFTGKSSAPPPGHPGVARRPRHRGPAARAKNCARAALHQAAKAAAKLAEAPLSSTTTLAPVSSPAPVSTSLQELQNRTSKEVGTVMCYVCDFDMCFPHLDSVNISCQCFVGEDSR